MKEPPFHLVFSDLDGTLLDHTDYSYTASLRGISILRERGIPLVLVSSKTCAEMTLLHTDLGLTAPFIFENGGGIAYPEGRIPPFTFQIKLQGFSVEKLRKRVPVIEKLLNDSLETIFDMSMNDIIERTGLNTAQVKLALERKSSLPFVLPSGKNLGIGELDAVNRKLRSYDLTMTRGDRFYHLSSIEATKGEAIRSIISFYRKTGAKGKIISTGIGDSENDIPMFKSVTRPILVRKHDSTYIKTGMKIKVTKAIGPAGFTEAMEGLFG